MYKKENKNINENTIFNNGFYPVNNKINKLINKKSNNEQEYHIKPGFVINQRIVDGDRFIPFRNKKQVEIAQYKIQKHNSNINPSFSNKYYKNALSKYLFDNISNKIIYHSEVYNIYDRRSNHIKEIKNNSKLDGNVIREIIILCAPDLINDYYSNLLDIDNENNVYTFLDDRIYSTNIDKILIKKHEPLEYPIYKYPIYDDVPITSLKYINNYNILCSGDYSGYVKIWDIQDRKVIKTIGNEYSRVISIDNNINKNIITYGTESGIIFNIDIRMKYNKISSFDEHSKSVCKVKWSYDGNYLASGGNDDMVYIIDIRKEDVFREFDKCNAAIKALEWSPTSISKIAIGGGSSDSTIFIWDMENNNIIKKKKTESQITSLIWLKEHKKIISSYGFIIESKGISVWDLPHLNEVHNYKNFKGRVLHMTANNQQSYIVSLSTDENMIIWEIMEKKKGKRKTKLAKNKKINIRIR